MTKVYIVTYDICDPKRLRKVYECMRGWGDHLQYSVFMCHLSDVDLARLKFELSEIIDFYEDQVLFFDLGPANGRGKQVTRYLGAPYVYPERNAVVF